MAATIALTASTSSSAAENELNETAIEGTNVTFTVSAEGNPAPTFQWLKDGAKIPGATGPTLVLPNVSSAHKGVYNVLATNSAGWSLSNDLLLNVGAALSTLSAPAFTLQPFPSASTPTGSTITLSALAVGTPSPSYQWYKNGTALAGATNSTLTLTSVTTNDIATYSVTATNSAGTVTSKNSALTVADTTSAGDAPIFAMHPMSQAIAEGSNVSFKVIVSGTPEPYLQWMKDGAVIPNATGLSYTIFSATSSHSGTYSVIAKSSAGSTVSQGAMLKVISK